MFSFVVVILLIYNKVIQNVNNLFPVFIPFLSFSSVSLVPVQPAVDIPGVDLVFLEAAEPLEGSQGGKKANAGEPLTGNTQDTEKTFYILGSLT